MPDRYLVDWPSDLGDGVANGYPGVERLYTRHDVDRFCALLGRSGPSFAEHVGLQRPDVEGEEGAAGYSARTPWVTLVLGSECLEIDAPDLSPSEFLSEVEAALDAHLKDENRSRHVAWFAVGLLDRYPGRVLKEQDQFQDLRDARERASEGFSPWEAILLECAALLNQTYYRAMAAQRGAISRWGKVSVRLNEAYPPSDDLDSDQEGDINLLLRQMEDLEGLLPDGSKVRKLVEQLRLGVDSRRKPEISLLNLRAITELAWQLLMKREAADKGWSEILIALSTHREARVTPHGMPRPRFGKPGAVVQAVRDVLEPMTGESIRQLYDETTTEQERAYYEFARLLHAQARIRERAMSSRYGLSDHELELGALVDSSFEPPYQDEPGSVQHNELSGGQLVVPPATAIITTFDVELELALSRHFPGRPFVVAMPIDVSGEVRGKQRAKGLWLAYVVRPPEDRNSDELVKAILHPPPSRWFIMSGSDLDGPPPRLDADAEELPPLRSMPVVVRLTGAPLVHLPTGLETSRPNLWNSLKARALLGEDTDRGLIKLLRVEHAVLLEENQALRWSLPELIQGDRRGLPAELMGTSDHQFWRYWALVGVQLSDSVVRYRLMAELVATGLLQKNPAGYRWPRATGLAVNHEYLGARAAETLLWSEFDVVQDRCSSITEGLSHYTEHLEEFLTSGRVVDWPSSRGACTLADIRHEVG